MKRLVLYLFLFTPLFALTAMAGDQQEPYTKLLTKYIEADGPGVAVIATRGDEVLFKGARGLANIELNVPLSSDSVFRLGSITKQFTAAAIMMLQEQGKLSIKDNLHQYVPDFPTEGNEVSIENLLTHTSGIANYTEDEMLFKRELLLPVTLNEMLVRFAEHPMELKTGDAMRYSNTGYVLLGKIIEVASGEKYPDFIEQHIFKKLGMNASQYGGLQIIPNRAAGYDPGENGIVNSSYIDMMWPHAAGSLLSTVGDLDIWFKALRSGKLISEQSYQQMITPFELNDGSMSGYGFGLRSGKLNKYDSISHNGGIPGFSTSAMYFPEKDTYVAVLSNFAAENSGFIARLIAAEAMDIPVPVFEPVELDEDAIERFMGAYQVDADSSRVLTLEGGKVYSQRGDGRKFEIFPMSDNSFYFENSLTYMVIETNDDGELVMNMFSNLVVEPQQAIRH